MAIGNTLGKLFGKSPLSPIQEHMGKSHAAAARLPGLVAAASAGDWQEAAALHKEVIALAATADKLKMSLRMDLRKSVFMPVARSDLLELLTSQDRVADHSEAIANLIMTRKLVLPEKARSAFEVWLKAVVSASELALAAIMELDEVFEVGFAQREIDVVYGKLKELNRQEINARKLEAKLRGTLFKIEESLEPLEAMFIYQLVGRVSRIARDAEQIGNRLLILISI
jgi:predicted phosphate transport protein (TIGR00153 family)